MSASIAPDMLKAPLAAGMKNEEAISSPVAVVADPIGNDAFP